ncbi:cysteine-rich perinuclear theca protein 1-like isoform X2 [Mus caroli]|uniref:Cysteine-rich perinuclear theca protein 1-like isoform X2 n=1 Tax=Mus caroli TaxID=10089 RepID=A0A6P5P5J9_MUSCR|nr:cysteine-rich perinuclear theca protein 1-like isoform X2 [Mus caroli]
MAQMAKKVHCSSAALGAAAAAKMKLKKTTKRFKINKKRNPSSKLPKRSSHSLICSRSRSCCCYLCRSCCYCRPCCRCCCSRSRRFRSRATSKFFQITEKGEQSLQRRIRRQLMQSQLEQSQLELIELEPTMALEPSEITMTFFSHKNANVSDPEEVPPCRDSDPFPNGDLASS